MDVEHQNLVGPGPLLDLLNHLLNSVGHHFCSHEHVCLLVGVLKLPILGLKQTNVEQF